MTGPAITRFAILAAPRTGSNWLCTLLDSHPDVLCHHELFNPKGIHYAVRLRDTGFSLGTMEERERDPLALVERAFSTPLGRAAVGFKINWSQNERVFDALLHDPGIKKLITVRRNRVKTFVSELVALQTGQWESYVGRSARGGITRVRVEPDALREHIERNDVYYAGLRSRLDDSGSAHITVAYEDLGSDEERARVLRFIGVAPSAHLLEAGTFKRNPVDLEEIITNYRELSAALAGTGLEAELHAKGL